MSLRDRAAYGARLLRHRIGKQPRVCPYCSSADLALLGRKKLIQDVLKCQNCSLIFRYPQDSSEETERYYEGAYSAGVDSTGIVSELPSDEELDALVSSGFASTSIDLSAKIKLLRTIVPHGTVLDFGASWGYGVAQLEKVGYRAVGFEVSTRRAAFGRARLGVDVRHDPVGLEPASFDAIFSNHVLEHLGAGLAPSLDLFARLLRPGGTMLHITPNFEGATARAGAFWSWIGQSHPIAPTRDFLRKALSRHGFKDPHFGTGPFDSVVTGLVAEGKWEDAERDGDELFVVTERKR